MKDHNKERIYERAKTAFEDVEASKYILHCSKLYNIIKTTTKLNIVGIGCKYLCINRETG